VSNEDTTLSFNDSSLPARRQNRQDERRPCSARCDENAAFADIGGLASVRQRLSTGTQLRGTRCAIDFSVAGSSICDYPAFVAMFAVTPKPMCSFDQITLPLRSDATDTGARTAQWTCVGTQMRLCRVNLRGSMSAGS
jgi:hypothetical protein